MVDNGRSLVLVEGLRKAGHDAVHVRDYGLHQAEDEVIFDRAAREGPVLVSADTDFGTLLALRQATKPSVVLFRRMVPRRPEAQAPFLLSNLKEVAEFLRRGAVVVIEETRLRVRQFPISTEEDPAEP